MYSSCVPLVLFVLTLVEARNAAGGRQPSYIPSAYSLQYGIDLFGGKETLRLRARVGENSTRVAEAFFNRNGINDEPTRNTVTRMLSEAGGARCDACKTMVEHLHVYLRSFSMARRPQGADAQNKERVNVDEAQEATIIKMCSSDDYKEYNDGVKGYCMRTLGGVNRKAILRSWEGSRLDPHQLAAMKYTVCSKKLRECNDKTPLKSAPSQCQACMEAFETLDFNLRRDSTSISLTAAKDPMALRKNRNKKVVVPSGHSSPVHVAMRVEEVCGDLHKHFEQAPLETIQEVCEEIVSEYESEVKDAFSAQRYATHRIPVRDVCVDIAGVCDAQTFDKQFTRLLNFHANITSVEPKGGTPRRSEL